MSLSPMMRQYMTIKEQFANAILFFRLGDFYEMFFEDAKLVSRELELVLTGKECGLPERAPMCGVPFHSAESYISRLVEKGYKVAICEQLSDPKTSKTLVERGVIRVVTPGTVIEQSMLDEKCNNYLLALCMQGQRAGIAYADVSTGECMAFEFAGTPEALADELLRIGPKEILANEAAVMACAGLSLPVQPSAYESDAWQFARAQRAVLAHFQAPSLDAFGLSEERLAVCAAGALLDYIEQTQKNAMEHLRVLRRYASGRYMVLDAAARRNLELTRSMRRGSGRGTLLEMLDKTVTPMGARLLGSWVEQPLCVREPIERRLSAIETLKNAPTVLRAVREALKNVRDVERIVGRIAYNSLTPRHCLALGESFEAVYDLLSLLDGLQDPMLCEIRAQIDPLEDIAQRIRQMIQPDAPMTLADGGVIREGFDEELDSLRRAGAEGKQWISDMEQREREATGIKNLRIVFHKIFGYCIEVTKSFYDLVPLRYARRQTLANCERYVTPELQEMERKILGAADRAIRLEQELFAALKDYLAEGIERMQRTAEGLKTLDALHALATVALENNYVRPAITDDGKIDIRDGRHPVVERSLHDEMFVPNSTHMDTQGQRMMIVTGPNMAGKSTYMRQVALIVLMAHIGSFVPAKSASICLTDRIFTRIGASDDLAGGKSTFLVEMSETAQILRNATSRSLIVLDEIGRGTSTFDGLSIAWAVVAYLCGEQVGSKTLFATHYHELTELEGRLEGVVNFRIAVKEHGEDIIFLRRIERGGADKSFGIHVARLAGVPHPVVARAQEILARLEIANVSQASISANILEDNRKEQTQQVGLADFGALDLVEEVRALDVNSMTPMDALNALFRLREKARNI